MQTLTQTNETTDDKGLEALLRCPWTDLRPLPGRVKHRLAKEGLVTIGDVVEAIYQGRFATTRKNFGATSRAVLFCALRRQGLQIPSELIMHPRAPQPQAKVVPEVAIPAPRPATFSELVRVALSWPDLRPRQREVLEQHYLRSMPMWSVGLAMGRTKATCWIYARAALQALEPLREPALELLGEVIGAIEAGGGLLHKTDAIEMLQEPDVAVILFGLRLTGQPYGCLRDQFIYRITGSRSLTKSGMDSMDGRIRRLQGRLMQVPSMYLSLSDLGVLLRVECGFVLSGARLRCFAERVLGLHVSGDRARWSKDPPP